MNLLAATPTLAELADDAGLSQADIAHLTGFDKATVSRYWTTADWLDRLSWAKARELARVLPGMRATLDLDSIGRGFEQARTDLHSLGLSVEPRGIARAVGAGTDPARVAVALQAAAQLAGGDHERASRTLATSWGRDSDRALAHLFIAGGLLTDVEPLIEAATRAANTFRQEATGRFTSFMAYATIEHHTARATGAPSADETVAGRRQAAFLERSTMIGILLSTGDLDRLNRYASLVKEDQVVARVEDWALPTYCGDHRAKSDFYLPTTLSLTRTGAELAHEVATFPEAYLAYLAQVYLPRATNIDPTLGGHISEIADLINRRRPTIPDGPIANALDTLMKESPWHPLATAR
ncbi:MAG: hypothetical protein AAF531_10525 [Actinomycetota bacterium]